MADLAKLVVKLEAQSAQLTAELQKAKGQLNRFDSDVSKLAARIGQGIGLAVGGAAVGLGVLVKNSIDSADELGNLSQKIGISVEALSQLQYAAKLSDASNEDLQTGLTKLNKSIAEAGAGSGIAANAFRALGVNVRDQSGKLRDTESILNDVAAAYAGTSDGAAKTAITLDLFGRSGANLIPLLDSGADGINRFRAEADRLGLTISKNTSDAADQFDKNLKSLSATFEGTSRKIAEQLAPKLVDLTNIIADPSFAEGVKRIVDGAISAGEAIGRFVGKVGEFSQGKEFKKLANEADFLRQTIEKKTNGKGILETFGRDVDAELADAQKRLTEVNAQLDAIAKKAIQKSIGINIAPIEGADVAIPFRTDAPKQALDYAGALDKTGDAARKSAKAIDEWSISLQAARDIQDEVDRMLANQAEAQRAVADATAKIAAEGQRVFEATRTPVEAYAASIENLLSLLQQGAISQDTFNRAVEASKGQFDTSTKAADKWGEELKGAAQQAGASVQKSLADFIFNPFENGLKGLVVSFEQTLLRIAAELAASALIRQLATLGAAGTLGPVGVGVAGALSLAGFAEGGRPPVGVPSIVGEQGPELFVPQVAGTIIPNHELNMGRPSPVNLRVVNAFDTAVIGDYLNSAAGEQSFINLVKRNAGKVRALTASA